MANGLMNHKLDFEMSHRECGGVGVVWQWCGRAPFAHGFGGVTIICKTIMGCKLMLYVLSSGQ